MQRADIIRQEIEDLERLLQGNYSQWRSRECRAWLPYFAMQLVQKQAPNFFLTDQMQT